MQHHRCFEAREAIQKQEHWVFRSSCAEYEQVKIISLTYIVEFYTTGDFPFYCL